MSVLWFVAALFQMTLLGGWSEGERPAIYAAVYIVRSGTAVGTLSGIGLFRCFRDDSTWVNLRPNTITPGVGFYQSESKTVLYLAGGNGLHRSTDGGKSWKVLTGWQTKEVLSVAPDPVDERILYISTPFGIFKSTDRGTTWHEKMKGWTTWYVRRVIIDREDRQVLYGTGEDALYVSRDGAESWQTLSVGVPGIKWIFQHPVEGNVLLVGTEDHGVRVSFDRGATWRRASGLDTSAVYSFASTPEGAEIYACGFRTGVWRSVDNGASWTQIWNASDLDALYTICVDPYDTNHLLVGTNGYGIYASHDRGRTWRQAGLPDAHVKQIEVFPGRRRRGVRE